MKCLLILNRPPYDGSDVTWNALRLAEKLLDKGNKVRIFLMNDAVDLAREATLKPDYYDIDLVQMLKELVKRGVELKVCGTCMARCGIHKGKPYFEGAQKATISELAEWIEDSDRNLTF
jgi:uncharacterized protein involved in oxidation of intracellular sulfur